MNKNPDRFWIVILALGVLFDYLFWEQRVGVNYALFIFACLFGGFFLLLSNRIRPARNSLWLLIPAVIFSVFTFLCQEPLTKGLAFVFSSLTLFLLVVSYLGGRWPEYNLTDYILKFFKYIVSLVTDNPKFAIQVWKERDEIETSKKMRYFWAILRGLLIALPFVILFATLFSSADLVFEQKLTDFLDRFEFDDFDEYISRFLIIMFCAYILAGTFLYAASRSSDEKLRREGKQFIKPFLGITELTVVLGSVIVLFAIFVGIQFRYFFGGVDNIGVEGYTYSQYARRGFNELIWVAFVSMILILGLGFLTNRKTVAERWIFSGLSITIVSLVMVILVSAYQRIMLGISWHGFSRLRLYPRTFLIWLGLLFVTVVVLEIFRKEKFITFAALLASIGFAFSLALINIDAATVKHNVPRALNGMNINIEHLSSLSTDAVPPLVDEFLNPAYSEYHHQLTGAIIVCYMHYQSLEDEATKDAEVTYDWRSFNMSRWRAQKAIDSIQSELQEYGIKANRYVTKIRTPSGRYYECGLSDWRFR